jgi:deoxycytidylate deaminase
MTDRKNWFQYFMDIAKQVATRATCDRKHVGALIVTRGRSIIATGYNGSVAGSPHCDDVGHLMEDNHCVAGSVVISKMQTGHYNTGHRTVEKIFEQWQHPQKKGAMMRMKIRAANAEGVIVPDHIVDVWSKGKQPVYRLTSSLGRSTTVTAEHQFKTPAMWTALKDLRVGEPVALNGQPLYENPVWLREAYLKRNLTQVQLGQLLNCDRQIIRRRLLKFGIPIKSFTLGGWNRGLRRDETPGYKGRNVEKHSLHERARRYALSASCEVCSDTELLQVHHLDKDPGNDADVNLVTLCTQCHNLAHSAHARRESVVYDRIARIEAIGDDVVFDLQTAEHHNFVGDGFILHNCVRTVHAESNALAQAARNGAKVEGAIMYCTALPCWQCFKQICNAGISQVIYDEPYRAEEHLRRLYEHADFADVKVYRLSEDGTLITDRPEGTWKAFDTLSSISQ